MIRDRVKAEDHYAHAMALANELRMRPLVAHCHVGLGKLYRRTGDYEKAKTQLANGVAMMREMEMGLWLQKAEAELKELQLMRCPQCQQDNPTVAKFCSECGTRFALSCTKCGTELPAGAKFCLECGQEVGTQPTVESRFASPVSYTPKHLAEKILTSKNALEGERKQVTVLFADLKGSMELLADRDPEEARKLFDAVIEQMMEAVHRYEGTVNHILGDGIMALFGAPLAHEDHAVRACYAALRMQESVKRFASEIQRTQGIPIQIRVGLNSGEVIVGAIRNDLHMDYTAIGQTVHLAGRMEQMAMPGSVLLTPNTLRLAEGYVQVKVLGPVNVKGLNEPIEVYEITGAGSGTFSAASRRGARTYSLRRAHR